MDDFTLLIIIMGAIILFIQFCFAAKFSAVAEEKGHYGYFWWVFIFGIIGMILVVALPDRARMIIKDVKDKPSPGVGYSLSTLANQKETASIPKGSWQCKGCKKLNPSYTGTCSCGTSKYGN